MPKETIKMGKNSDPGNVFDVKVGWTKDSYMQIGIEEKDERSLFWTILDTKVEEIGMEVRKMIFHKDGPMTDEEVGAAVLNIMDCATHGPVGGIWTTPGRHEVNELIRVLRRARDSAFGRDE